MVRKHRIVNAECGIVKAQTAVLRSSFSIQNSAFRIRRLSPAKGQCGMRNAEFRIPHSSRGHRNRLVRTSSVWEGRTIRWVRPSVTTRRGGRPPLGNPGIGELGLPFFVVVLPASSCANVERRDQGKWHKAWARAIQRVACLSTSMPICLSYRFLTGAARFVGPSWSWRSDRSLWRTRMFDDSQPVQFG